MSTTQSRGAKSLYSMHAPPPIVVCGKVGRRHRIARQRRARRARPTVRPRLQLRDHTQRLGRSCTTRHRHIVDEANACVRGDQISANGLLDQRTSCLVEVVEHAGLTVPQLRVDGIKRVPVPARVSVPRYRKGGALARLRRACMHAWWLDLPPLEPEHIRELVQHTRDVHHVRIGTGQYSVEEDLARSDSAT